MSSVTAKDEAMLLKAMKIKPSMIAPVVPTQEFEALNFKVDIIYQDEDLVLQIHPTTDIPEALIRKAFSRIKRANIERVPELNAWWVRLFGYAGNSLAEEVVEESLNELDDLCGDEL